MVGPPSGSTTRDSRLATAGHHGRHLTTLPSSVYYVRATEGTPKASPGATPRLDSRLPSRRESPMGISQKDVMVPRRDHPRPGRQAVGKTSGALGEIDQCTPETDAAWRGHSDALTARQLICFSDQPFRSTLCHTEPDPPKPEQPDTRTFWGHVFPRLRTAGRSLAPRRRGRSESVRQLGGQL